MRRRMDAQHHRSRWHHRGAPAARATSAPEPTGVLSGQRTPESVTRDAATCRLCREQPEHRRVDAVVVVPRDAGDAGWLCGVRLRIPAAVRRPRRRDHRGGTGMSADDPTTTRFASTSLHGLVLDADATASCRCSATCCRMRPLRPAAIGMLLRQSRSCATSTWSRDPQEQLSSI